MTVEKGDVCDNRLWQYKENVNLIDLRLCTKLIFNFLCLQYYVVLEKLYCQELYEVLMGGSYYLFGNMGFKNRSLV